MGGEVDWGDSLPLLPAGTLLFDALPARAIVLSALAPALGDGLITLLDGDRRGVIVIRAGGISEVVSIDRARCIGDAAMASITGWDAALMSAARLTEDAMAVLGPVLGGQRCYEDLRLEWTRWSELLEDLQARGGTYVVEVRTPAGRGVTVIRAGQQVATYTDAHPSLGDPALIDELAEAGAGSLRVTVASETSAGTTALLAARTTHHAEDSAAILYVTSEEGAPEVMHPEAPQGTPVMLRAETAPAMRNQTDQYEGNATLTALFGGALGSQTFTPLVVLDRPVPPASSSVASLLPALKLLVQQRLQRSAGRVEDVVDAAADGGESLAWLADRVRVMTVRGFMTSTLEQLADDMLTLAID